MHALPSFALYLLILNNIEKGLSCQVLMHNECVYVALPMMSWFLGCRMKGSWGELDMKNSLYSNYVSCSIASKFPLEFRCLV